MSNKKFYCALVLTILLIMFDVVLFIECGFIQNQDLQPNSYGLKIHCEDIDLLYDCKDELDKIPDIVLQSFKKNGWHLYIGDKYIEKMQDIYGEARIIGLTRCGFKTIIVEDASPLLHEFGHFVYYQLGDDDFARIYQSEVSISKMWAYYNSNEAEYFAQYFDYFVNDVERYVDGLPLTKCYFEDLKYNDWGLAS